jgi:Toxin co-regulated pilus biosynthesis protein Q
MRIKTTGSKLFLMLSLLAYSLPSYANNYSAKHNPLRIADTHAKSTPSLINVSNKKPKPSKTVASGWSVKIGDDLEGVLRRWAKRAGWHIVWHSENRFEIAGNAHFPSTFVESVSQLMDAMQDARPSPVANIYPENRVIVVVDGIGETY